MSLSGKVVLVTGASAGIGRASAVALARAGAKIIATGRRAAELDTLRKQHGDAIETIAGDLNDAQFVAELAGRARNVDILVNNAGILKYEPLMEVDHGWCHSLYYLDPNGIMVEFCRDTPGFVPDPESARKLFTATDRHAAEKTITA